LFLFLSIHSHAVSIGCPDENKKEIQNFAIQVQKSRACSNNSDCTSYIFYKLGNGSHTFDSPINKIKLKSLIKKHDTLSYCHDGIAQCLIYPYEMDKVACENKMCTINFKFIKPSQTLLSPELENISFWNFQMFYQQM
jgi:hypothetical protein